jgi:O-antigen/teichoic acid export membrane protein
MIRRLAQSASLRLFSTAVIDQAMLSAANFAVGLLMIRYAPGHEYGYYVLAFSSIQLLVSAQGSWMSGPLAVLAPKRTDDQRRLMIGVIESSQRRFVRRWAIAAAPLPLLGAAMHLWPWHDAWIACATVVAGWMTLRREYMRSVLMIYNRPSLVLRLDTIYIAVLICAALLASLAVPMAGAGAVLGLAVAAALAGWHGRRSIDRSVGWQGGPAQQTWLDLRPLAKWGTLSAMIFWVYTQSYNFVLAGRLGLAEVVDVNAARLMLMPITLLSVGVGSLLIPNAAGWLHREGLPQLVRRLWGFCAGLLVLALIYIAFIWWCHEWVARDLMREQIGSLTMLLGMWSVLLATSMVRDVFQSALIALQRYREMAALTAVAAVCALGSMLLLIPHLGAPGAMAGMMVGEAISLSGVALLLAQSYRRHRAAPVTHSV